MSIDPLGFEELERSSQRIGKCSTMNISGIPEYGAWLMMSQER
jgi:hypothetical protein